MKCPNCGANFSSKELVCPYCGAENQTGRRWAAERRAAEQDYREGVRQAKRKMPLYILNRAMSWVLGVLAALVLLYVVGMFLFFFSGEAVNTVQNETQRTQIEQEMQRLYEGEEFGQLYQYMEKRDLVGPEYYEYTQMVLLHSSYEEFELHRLSFLALSEEEKQQDDYHLYYAIEGAHELLYPDIPAYPDITERNGKVLQKYADEARAYLIGTLGFSEEEIEALAETEYLSMDEADALVEKAKERRAWTNDR